MISPYSNTAESSIKITRIKEIWLPILKALIVKWILLVSDIGNVWSRVSRLWILMLGCKRLWIWKWKSALVIQGSLRVKALLLIFWLIFKSIRRKFFIVIWLWSWLFHYQSISPWEQYFSGLPYLQTSPFYFSLQMQKEEDRKFLSRKLLHLLEVSCGFSADVTTLLLDTTRKSFVFEDELNNTME